MMFQYPNCSALQVPSYVGPSEVSNTCKMMDDDVYCTMLGVHLYRSLAHVSPGRPLPPRSPRLDCQRPHPGGTEDFHHTLPRLAGSLPPRPVGAHLPGHPPPLPGSVRGGAPGARYRGGDAEVCAMGGAQTGRLRRCSNQVPARGRQAANR